MWYVCLRQRERRGRLRRASMSRSEEHTSELQSQSNLVCRLLLEKKNDRSRFQEVAPELGDDYAARDLADGVPSPAHTLDAGGDAGRRFDLKHEIDRSHVDAELEG